MILAESTGVNARWLSYRCRKLPMDQKAPDGSESSRWIRKLPMDQNTNCRTVLPKVRKLTKHEKSEKHQ